MDLSIYSPICLPDINANFVGKVGHVFGKEQKHITSESFPLICTGWGNTGRFSADKLQKTEVDILESNNCRGQLNEDEDEALIVCAGREGTGPCKVNMSNLSVSMH